ncbi:MAG: GntR family transcriptional regulator [Chloroflexota bacterium]|nr:GntR family transcriptional regulator [Chloroflexota bacterium]
MNSPLLLLNHDSPVPPYEQMRLQIIALIASVQLLPGDRLPSVRQLARDLGVSPNTVVRAYNELEREGWVITSTRRNVSVASHPPFKSLEERKEKLAQSVSYLLTTMQQLGISIEEIHAEIDRQARVAQEK